MGANLQVTELQQLRQDICQFRSQRRLDLCLAAFVRNGDRLLEDVGVAIGIRARGVWGLDVQDLAEIDEERLRI